MQKKSILVAIRLFAFQRKIFLIAGLWICIMEGDSLQERTYNHIAFQIQSEEVDEYIERIKALGVEIKPERPRVEGEGRWIYFMTLIIISLNYMLVH